MNARHLLAALIGIAVLTVAPAMAEEATGKVREIIIKIDTPDGPRWYSLGVDLKQIDIKEGAVVRFNYADDTIESIEVEEVTPNGKDSSGTQ